jgi:uridine kinase
MSLVLGISGGSGSGKTSFIRDIKKLFPPHHISVLSQDDYYRSREEQELDEKGICNFDLPESIDLDAFRNDIIKIKTGKSFSKLEYTFNNDSKPAETIEHHPAPVIIIEGLFIYHYSPINELLDYKILLHANDSFKIIRRIKRDQLERNYPIDDVLYRYQYHVLPAYEKYIDPFRDKVDIVINNNRNYDNGLNILAGFIKDYLRSHVTVATKKTFD